MRRTWDYQASGRRSGRVWTRGTRPSGGRTEAAADAAQVHCAARGQQDAHAREGSRSRTSFRGGRTRASTSAVSSSGRGAPLLRPSRLPGAVEVEQRGRPADVQRADLVEVALGVDLEHGEAGAGRLQLREPGLRGSARPAEGGGELDDGEVGLVRAGAQPLEAPPRCGGSRPAGRRPSAAHRCGRAPPGGGRPPAGGRPRGRRLRSGLIPRGNPAGRRSIPARSADDRVRPPRRRRPRRPRPAGHSVSSARTAAAGRCSAGRAGRSTRSTRKSGTSTPAPAASSTSTTRSSPRA